MKEIKERDSRSKKGTDLTKIKKASKASFVSWGERVGLMHGLWRVVFSAKNSGRAWCWCCVFPQCQAWEVKKGSHWPEEKAVLLILISADSQMGLLLIFEKIRIWVIIWQIGEIREIEITKKKLIKRCHCSLSHLHSKYEPVLALVDVKIEASTRQRGARGSLNTWKARVGGSFELASLRSTSGGKEQKFQRAFSEVEWEPRILA